MFRTSFRSILFLSISLAALSLHLDAERVDDGVTLRVDVASPAHAARNRDHCVREQAGGWDGDNYQVRLTNTCREPIRVHWCVTKSDGHQHCQVHSFVPPRGLVAGTARNAARPLELRFEACPQGERCRLRR